jgi:Uma2 family endonuclease
MMSVALERTYTPQDLLAMPDGQIYELDDGRLVERDMSMLSSWVAGALLNLVWAYAGENKLGRAWGANVGYACFPNSPREVRCPDVSFIRAGRLPAGLASDEGLGPIAPDLAVEVRSPTESAYMVQKKVDEYLSAGAPLVWVIYPASRGSYVCRRDGSVAWLNQSDHFSGEEVIPGFRCNLPAILPEKALEQAAPGSA